MDTNITKVEEVVPVKRGRGRPKGSLNKPKITQPDGTPLEVVKRKRGRPPKNPVAVVEQTGEQPIKRGRGRPKGSKNTPKVPKFDKAKRLGLIKESWARVQTVD